jgi:phosphotriesterase-related protein
MEGQLQVMTVLGPIAPESVGVTLTHDHVLIDAFGLFGDSSYAWILDDEDVMARELERYRDAGGATIVDPTNIGLKRQPEGMRRLAQRTGLNLVMGTGWYRERCYPGYIREELPDQLADRLVADLVSGMDGTDVRAGFIGEIGTERGFITPAQERVFRAAGRAHRRTGCPIMTHTTHFGELAVEQLALLREEGVDPSRVVVSHLGDRVGIHWWLPIAREGAYLNIDNLGFVGGYAPLEVRADNVAAFVAEGLVDQVMLSNDICLLDQLAQYGGPGYDNVITNFVPLLRARGVSDGDVQTMLVINPSRAFAYDAEGARLREAAEA